MNKYTPSELQGMAQQALADRAQGGIDYMFLIMTMCQRTGLSSDEVERRISQLAKTGGVRNECE